MNKFGLKLKAYREEKKLSKKQLAFILGWTAMYYARFENGDILPSKFHYGKFANLLGISEVAIEIIIKEDLENLNKQND
jgi:transcriptional regulator with XRE-family HTH domain